MEIERPLMNYFSVKKNPYDIFKLINCDDLIVVDDDEEEAEYDTSIHDVGKVIKNEKQSIRERPIRVAIKKTVQVALSKKQSNCNGITGRTAEHGNAVCSQDMGSQNSNKRKRPDYKASRKTIADQYKSLMENWNPPSLQSYNFGLDDDDDQSWLFQRKPKQARVEEKNVGSSSALWPPRAQYLPDVDIYALPYTVPF